MMDEGLETVFEWKSCFSRRKSSFDTIVQYWTSWFETVPL